VMKSSSFTILFMEDDLGLQKVYEGSFSSEGYQVIVAAHGARALADLKDREIDLLVADLSMPGMNTLELLKILKREHPRLPVIVVAGHPVNLSEASILEGIDVKAFFTKPVVVSELAQKIRQILKIDDVQ
jgi:CheY-like chemotaxis protein